MLSPGTLITSIKGVLFIGLKSNKRHKRYLLIGTSGLVGICRLEDNLESAQITIQILSCKTLDLLSFLYYPRERCKKIILKNFKIQHQKPLLMCSDFFMFHISNNLTRTSQSANQLSLQFLDVTCKRVHCLIYQFVV